LRMKKKPKSLGPRMGHHTDFCAVKSTSNLWPFLSVKLSDTGLRAREKCVRLLKTTFQTLLYKKFLKRLLLTFSRSSTVKILESLRRKLLGCSFLSALRHVSRE